MKAGTRDQGPGTGKTQGRKPVDQVGRLESRDAIWALIRECKGEFTATGTARETLLSVSTVQEYLTGLVNAGYLAYTPPERPFQPGWYRLVKDIGIEAPRVRKDGSAVTMGQGRYQMWQALWLMAQKAKLFTVKDLLLHSVTETCAIAESEAETYLYHLQRAGYITRRGDGYVMSVSRWTGPKPPMIQRIKQVWDPNTRQVMWQEGASSDHN